MSMDELPDELIHILADQWPCRDAQLRQLSVLLAPSLSIATIVVQGPHATGKSEVLRAYLKAIDTPYAIIRCQECITERHLLEQTARAVEEVVTELRPEDAPSERTGKCENLNALVSQLQNHIKTLDRFILVFDGVDKQREASSTLGPALARLGEIISSLTTVLVVQDSLPGAWRTSGIPHVIFPAYTRDQSIHIVSRIPLDIFNKIDTVAEEYTDELHEEDKAWLWPRYCAAVWDSMGQSAARDLCSFSDLCLKLWRPFVGPIIKGELGTRNFSRLMVVQRRLFQDESVLLDHITDAEESITQQSAKMQSQLPYYAKWMLLAAFLASTNPTRMDAIYFMKTTDKKKRKKSATNPASKASHKMPRHLLAPAPFAIDRLLAILHAILPDDLRSSIDIHTQIATLTSLRLLSRSTAVGLGDAIEASSKWKIGSAVTWETAMHLASSLDFPVSDYMAV